MIYRNSVLIPEDKEFLEHKMLLQDSKQLAALYHVPSNVITTKIVELAYYDPKRQNIGKK